MAATAMGQVGDELPGYRKGAPAPTTPVPAAFRRRLAKLQSDEMWQVLPSDSAVEFFRAKLAAMPRLLSFGRRGLAFAGGFITFGVSI